MQERTRKQSLLKILSLITACTLIGIIGLQVYWLRLMYNQQKSAFYEQIESATMAAVFKSKVSFVLPDSATAEETMMVNGMMNEMGDMLRKVVKKSTGDTAGYAAQKKAVRSLREGLDKMDGPNKDTSEHVDIREKETDTSLTATNLNKILNTYKELLTAELTDRGIKANFQLAILDTDGHIMAVTCDSNLFKKIPIKPSDNSSLPILPHNYVLQSAFPDAGAYLMRHMAWILFLSALLILICGVSFSYLLVLSYRQKKLSDIRNDFMNNVTHELKTPISSVSIALELLQDRAHPLSEEARYKYFSAAQGELKRLAMMVDKILKIAAFENREIKIAPESFLVAPWVKDLTSNMKPLFEKRGALINTSIKPELLSLFTDKAHMANVLQNLLENAIKYNDKKTPKIDISIYESAMFTTIEVADNGRGIPAQYIDKVFDKFFRVPAGDIHDIKGYGLGLNYVKSVVDLHRGTISVSSKQHEGSTFVIQLPIKKAI